uniref:DZANK-type domain-containing protein n=1 Tax=Sexangularia sp. CB-2014 TaxID=1486929 RepID=A0A7S1VEI6_9EUKA|mmetsp:Transcript_16270/g.50939  ORF Transcript_16270/g.50939 Transcript_16270/m.50939 type:complete len:284 (+) Transcript_16270:53-904(+)
MSVVSKSTLTTGSTWNDQAIVYSTADDNIVDTKAYGSFMQKLTSLFCLCSCGCACAWSVCRGAKFFEEIHEKRTLLVTDTHIIYREEAHANEHLGCAGLCLMPTVEKSIPIDRVQDIAVTEAEGFECLVRRTVTTVAIQTAGQAVGADGSPTPEVTFYGLRDPQAFKKAVFGMRKVDKDSRKPGALAMVRGMHGGDTGHGECASCGLARLRSDSLYCAGCGKSVGTECRKCSTVVPVGAAFCDHCGSAVEGGLGSSDGSRNIGSSSGKASKKKLKKSLQVEQQ